MLLRDISRSRLSNQQISRTELASPGDLVAWLGAVQAQDYSGGKWALGVRLPDCTDVDIEQAITNRIIVRTWPMRGTLHFVPAADVRLMLELLTPRIVAGAAKRLRRLGLDDSVIARSRDVIVKGLSGKQLTRGEMYRLLEQAHISTSGGRGLQLLGRLAQEGFICLAVRHGKQPTFALLDEWVPRMRKLKREEALAELAFRYFRSRGPATLQDFAWWSGLLIGDARAGLESVKSQFMKEIIDGRMYWMPQSTPKRIRSLSAAYLLPVYDEYFVGYRDRAAALLALRGKRVNPDEHIDLGPAVVIDGQIVGTWKRTFIKGSVVINLRLFRSLTQAENRALAKAVARYSKFLNIPLTVVVG